MTTARPRLWIVSPVYLDVDSYLQVRDEAKAVLARAPGLGDAELRFVAVDDTGGVDPAVERLRACADVTVIVPPFNLGHQRALVFALRTLASSIAADDYVVTMDSDGEDRPADLPTLLAPLLAAGGELRTLALAQRTRRTESLTFKILYFFFRILFRTATGRLVRSGNFAAYRGWLVRHVLFHPHFDLCYSSSLVSLDLAVTPVPLARGTRYAGASRMSYSRLLTHGVSMLLPFTDRIAIRALVAVAVVLGTTLLALGATLAWSLALDSRPPTWLALAMLLLNLLAFVAFGNLVLLFAAFVQTRGSLLRGIEREHGELARGSRPGPA